MSDLARRRNEDKRQGDLTAMREQAAKFATAPPEGWTPPPEDPNRCQLCDNTGWVKVEGGVQRCSECLTRTRGQAPGIPIDEHGSRLATFTETADNKQGIEHARHFLDGIHPDIYLWGGIGTGKTRLACSLLNELHARMVGVEFFRVPLLLSALLPGADDMDAKIERLASIPVICLDDVGASQATDFARRMLLVIYEARGDRGRRTIWTSNLSIQELADFTTDDRLPSRIAGRAKVVELGGKDWRLRKRR